MRAHDLNLFLNLGRAAKTPVEGFDTRTGETDMPEVARNSAIPCALTASPPPSDGHPLVLIALFSGVGLLVSLAAMLMGLQDAWF